MRLFILIFLIISSFELFAANYLVGLSQTYTNCSQVAPLVQDGDTVSIDPAIYTNVDQVQWTKNNLLIRGIGPTRPVLSAGITIATDAVNGKGIFVISGNNVTVENIEFWDCEVIDNNGAGIRHEGKNLTVRNCMFYNNQNGILDGGLIAGSKVLIEYCEFYKNGHGGGGYSHNLYINHVDTLVFRYNYSHDAEDQGHELKSRANVNYILYNRIANEISVDSRTIDLPNGGTSIVMGNVIEQNITSANNNILGYGLEGCTNAGLHNLYLINNTFINKHNVGSYIHLPTNGVNIITIKNNIFAGPKNNGLIIGTATSLDSSGNIIDDNIGNVGFENSNLYNYHLLNTSTAVDAGVNYTNTVYGILLQPNLEYVDTAKFTTRNLSINKIDAGAFEMKYPLATPYIDLNNIEISPNPASNFIKLQNSIFNEYTIVNLSGTCIKTGALNNNLISLEDLKPGTYFLTLKNKNTFKKAKFIKTN